MIDAPFTLMIVHPYVFVLMMLTLIALCFVPALLTRKHDDTLDPAFVASFATPHTASHVRVLPSVTTLPSTPMYAHLEAAAQACVPVTQGDWDQVVEDSLTHTAHKIQRVVDLIEQVATGTRLDEVDWMDAGLSERLNAVQTPVRIEHFASSTERMRAQRAAYAAQGLTARGTQPLPTCEGVTKQGAPCKRKAQTGTTTCSLDHATTDAALALWM